MTEKEAGYFVATSHPRIVDGKPTKNPRYLQLRPDLSHPRDAYVARMGVRMNRKLPLSAPLAFAGQRRVAGSPQ